MVKKIFSPKILSVSFLILFLATAMNGCQVIGGIFKAGFVIGIIVVVIILIIIGAVVRMFKK